MGNDNTKWIAKDTFEPSENEFYNFPLDKANPDAAREAYLLRVENPLRIVLDSKLDVAKEKFKLVGTDNTELWRMKNMENGEVGLVLRHSVGRIGTVECER